MNRQIETPRLVLRGFQMADVAALARLYGDDVIMRHMVPGRGLARGEAETRARANVINFAGHWRRHGFGVWAVTDRDSGHLLGQCGLRWVADAAVVELLYLLNKTTWGRGLATEAAAAALDHGFAAGRLSAVVGLTRPDNIASKRVLSKLGFRFEALKAIWGLELAWHGLPRAAWTARGTAAPVSPIPPPAQAAPAG